MFDGSLIYEVSKKFILYFVIEKKKKKNITQDKMHRSYAHNWWAFASGYTQAIITPNKI